MRAPVVFGEEPGSAQKRCLTSLRQPESLFFINTRTYTVNYYHDCYYFNKIFSNNRCIFNLANLAISKNVEDFSLRTKNR